ncbi:hypothetical protein PIB30_095640 [Stylosanthes scabra]|uniref:Uncharacterized protein n=1 Tax=Stylosanthes scabra TaxID=79078 RepID=A0ABU6WU35_9FABA|nr:hypothetical protein [Stylosanthes scabra]
MQHMSNSDPNHRNRPSSPDTKPLPPSSWAEKTGFRPKLCGETNATDSGQLALPPSPPQPAPANTDLEAARPRPPANGVPPPTDTVPPAVPVPVPVPVPLPPNNVGLVSLGNCYGSGWPRSLIADYGVPLNNFISFAFTASRRYTTLSRFYRILS